VGGGEDAADDHILLLPILRYLARFAVLEGGEDAKDVLRAIERNLAALITEAPSHRHPERGGIDELHLALVRRRLAVRHHPHVGRDPRVVKELLGKRDQRLQQVGLEDEPADLALAATRIAGEERRAVHDDGDARAAFLRVLGVRQHVEQEEELSVADPR
jgi:hypothetical protein